MSKNETQLLFNSNNQFASITYSVIFDSSIEINIKLLEWWIYFQR